MGYNCPVCGDPQADDIHLANHLAFTALSRGGDHERWLDETVSSWGSMSESELAEVVTDLAEETEFPQVFEDTTGQHQHDHETQGLDGSDSSPPRSARGDDMPETADISGELDDEDVDSVLEEAVEMTRQRRTDEESENE